MCNVILLIILVISPLYFCLNVRTRAHADPCTLYFLDNIKGNLLGGCLFSVLYQVCFLLYIILLFNVIFLCSVCFILLALFLCNHMGETTIRPVFPCCISLKVPEKRKSAVPSLTVQCNSASTQCRGF